MQLPPLTALRAFEAAARTGSYVAAAREIGVSPAAISQHVRKLEDFLGKRLFERLNNGLRLTDAGQVVFEGANAGLQLISETTRRNLLSARRSHIAISCIESIAEKWLAPQLAEYALAHADFRFDLRVEADPVDFAESGLDLRLAYDAAPYAGQVIVPLSRDVVLPLCGPAFLDRHPSVREQGMAAVTGEDILDIDWGPDFGSRPTWEEWFAAAGLAPLDVTRGARIGNSAIALDLARAGLGVVLGQRVAAGADLAAGRLVALSQVTLPLRHGYGLVFPPSRQRKRPIADLARWLAGRWASAERPG